MDRNVLVIVVLAIIALLAVGVYTQRDTLQAMLGNNLATVYPSPQTYGSTDSSTPELTVSPQATNGASMTKVMVALTEQNYSGQTGTATLTQEDGKVMVSLAMVGGNFTTPQPAHIHIGACPTPGVVKYPLTNVTNGESETTLSVDMKTLMSQSPLAVNVHKSAAEVAVYTACGDIKATTASPAP